MVRVREANWSIQSAGSCANERIAVRNKVRIVQLLSQPPPVSPRCSVCGHSCVQFRVWTQVSVFTVHSTGSSLSPLSPRLRGSWSVLGMVRSTGCSGSLDTLAVTGSCSCVCEC